MNETITQRVAALRALLKREGVAAFIIPSTDPHMSEYVAPHWQSRKWISGFTGSAGTVVITADKAGLWTDSRYFLQATKQLEGTSIDLYKLMMPETPSIEEFLTTELKAGETVGIDGCVFSAAEARQIISSLEKKSIHVRNMTDPMSILWEDRPAISEKPAFIHDLKYAGRSCMEKLSDIRQVLQEEGAEAILVSALDEIAWALNLRGEDVHCNPVVISYLLIERSSAHFFINSVKITPEVNTHLQEAGVTLHPYESLEEFLNGFSATSILIEPNKTNFAAATAINKNCRIIEKLSPLAILKAIRNDIEAKGIRNALRRDGVAMVKFLMWLEEVVPTEKETEITIDQKLHALRAEQPLYMGESFDTIAGYGAHAALPHYFATPESAATLHPHGFLLVDSGAQYLDGTTDITRTIALGELTNEEKTDYTIVLKGHINLARAVFPEGTRGCQIDVLTRIFMWQHRMNYLHGTGHGVGHFLNVHEGPQSIRQQENPVTLRIGMVSTNEPGIYKAESHGIRTENMMLIVPAGEGLFGNYLQFETITLCPICKKGIIKEMLHSEETDWLNNYHQMVYEQLAPELNEKERAWLREACRAI